MFLIYFNAKMLGIICFFKFTYVSVHYLFAFYSDAIVSKAAHHIALKSVNVHPLHHK